MKLFVIYVKVIGLFFLVDQVVLAQKPDNLSGVEFGETRFSIERSFTISVILPNTEARPLLTFPDIPGLTKRGTVTGVRGTEGADRDPPRLVITQSYAATAAGQYRVPPFAITVNGQTVRSEGVMLIVEGAVNSTSGVVEPAPAVLLPRNPGAGDAFLSLTTGKLLAFAGEGVPIRLSLLVAENYPAELRFDQLDAQIQSIIEALHPPGTWAENTDIQELKPVSMLVGGRRFSEYLLYRATLFSLTGQPIPLPAVSLAMLRLPLPSAKSVASGPPERVVFSSRPVTVAVRPLPPYPVRVAVGQFRLVESLSVPVVGVGRSVRYEFGVAGVGNIAGLSQPVVRPGPDMTIYPPDIQTTIDRTGGAVSGHKTFRYFVLPRQTGSFALAGVFGWVYFDPVRARYDTLRPALRLTVTGTAPALMITPPELTPPDSSRLSPADPGAAASIYAGLAQLDSTRQPLNTSVLLRAFANVLLIGLLLSLLFVFLRK